jgi:hypothetical protein
MKKPEPVAISHDPDQLSVEPSNHDPVKPVLIYIAGIGRSNERV